MARWLRFLECPTLAGALFARAVMALLRTSGPIRVRFRPLNGRSHLAIEDGDLDGIALGAV
jgi:hypothetical protein